MLYFGGLEQTFEFDFGTKIAGSTKECPLEIYYTKVEKIQDPSNITNNWQTGWEKFSLTQSIDLVKTKDGLFDSTTTPKEFPNRYTQVMIELDLNHLANDLFGGSNEALRNAMQSIEVSTWACGSGSNNGKKETGVITSLYCGSNKHWWKTPTRQLGGYDVWNTNSSDKPYLSSFKAYRDKGCGYKTALTNDNKIYVVIYSKYPSDTNIPSQVLLDYVNIKITMSRKHDKAMPTPINLKDKGSILVRFSPNFGCKQEYYTVFDIHDGSWKNRVACHFNETKDTLAIFGVKDSETLWTAHFSSKGENNLIYDDKTPYKPYKLVSLLLSWDSEAKKVTRFLLYDNKITRREVTVVDILTGDLQLNLGSLVYGSNTLNGFIEDFQYMPDKTFSEEEAKKVLKGEHKYFERPNLAKLGDMVYYHNEPYLDVQYSNNKIILTNKQDGWSDTCSIKYKVLPNNTYKFEAFDGNSLTGLPHVQLYNSKNQFINDIIITKNTLFQTTDDTEYVCFHLYPYNKKGSTTVIDRVNFNLVP